MKFSEIANNIQEIERQKDLSKELLLEISEYFDYALVAGGAPRNWTFGKTANDIDIYVLRERDSFKQKEIDKKIAKSVMALSKKYGFGKNRASMTVNSNVYGGFILNSLYDFKVPGTPSDEGDLIKKNSQDCQFIIIDDGGDESVYNNKSFSERIFSTYDFGICMTSVDKDGNIYNSPMFEKDVRNKTFTCNVRELRRNNNSGLQKLVERFEKMENYFPSHSMRIIYQKKTQVCD